MIDLRRNRGVQGFADHHRRAQSLAGSRRFKPGHSVGKKNALAQSNLIGDILDSPIFSIGVSGGATLLAAIAGTQLKGALAVAAWIVAVASGARTIGLVASQYPTKDEEPRDTGPV